MSTMLLTPAPEVSLEKAMQFIKGGFSFLLKSKLDVWERSYDSRRIANDKEFFARLRYIHENPAEEFLVARAKDYLFSSAAARAKVDPMPAHFIRQQ